MAHYKARGQLHLADTRDQAAENAVQAWAQLTEHHDIRQVALIADASNKEIDRLNARAQHIRAQRSELGPREIHLTDTHYGIRVGDHVAFIAQHRPPRQPGVENGTRAEVTRLGRDGTVTLTLTGGWQTSKEGAYVQASRAHNGTDWHLARDQLGQEGQDPDKIMRLADRMSGSRAHTPSIAYRETSDPAWNPTLDPLRVAELIPYLDPPSPTPKARQVRLGSRSRPLRLANQQLRASETTTEGGMLVIWLLRQRQSPLS
jgi:hypothetical protein